MTTEKQKRIIKEMKVQPEIDPTEEIRKSIDFMKDYLLEHSFLKTLVLGVSGGQDSTLLARLAQMAVEEVRAEIKNEDYQFIAIRLPYGDQFDEDVAQQVLDWINPDQTFQVDIKSSVDALVDSFDSTDVKINDFNKGNIKARARMIAEYAIAGENSGVVIGADHSAEAVTGFFTKYGDGGTDIDPLFRLNKRQGVALLKELGAPASFYKQTPTADLEDNKPGISDEEKLGVSYESIDDYLEGKDVPKKDKETIENWFDSTKHKRHMPITIFDEFWR